MAERDLEKQAMAAIPDESDNTAFSPEKQIVGGNADVEKHGNLRKPPGSIGPHLSPSVSRQSRLRSVLSPSRSYADSRTGYFSNEDDEEPETQDERNPEEHFEVKWDGGDDPMNPRSMSTARKWVIVFTLAFGSFCVTCVSSLYTTTYDQIDKDFHCSRIVSTLGLALFVWGLGLSPMVLGPISEFYGRRPVYIGAYLFFTIWLIPCALAKNIATMLIARFLDGLAGSAFLSVAGGSVGDMFPRERLQAPMMIYTASPFIGPSIGPIIGGFINYNVSWRWSFYMLLIWSGAMFLAMVFIVPETYHPVLLRKKARKLRKETGDERYKAPIEVSDRTITMTLVHSLYRPFMLLFLEPMCLNLCLYSSILLGILYLFFGAFDVVFANVYGFNLWQIGTTFTGLILGMLIAICSDSLWHKNYLRLIRNKEMATGNPGTSEPEYRLPPSIGGAPLCVIGLFWFAWTIYPSVHWIVPIIGAGIFGCGTILVFSGVSQVPSYGARLALVECGHLPCPRHTLTKPTDIHFSG